jgi:hypothetical protein
MLTVTLPLLVSVILLARLLVPTGWLPKFSFVGTSCTKVPVPVCGTFCGLPGALSVTLTVPWNTPLFLGWNLTLIVQFAPGSTLLG